MRLGSHEQKIDTQIGSPFLRAFVGMENTWCVIGLVDLAGP